MSRMSKPARQPGNLRERADGSVVIGVWGKGDQHNYRQHSAHSENSAEGFALTLDADDGPAASGASAKWHNPQ
jgi:hypothetical protein